MKEVFIVTTHYSTVFGTVKCYWGYDHVSGTITFGSEGISNASKFDSYEEAQRLLNDIFLETSNQPFGQIEKIFIKQ